MVWFAAMASCHLADDLDPPKCPAGSHPDNDRCNADAPTGPSFTISGAPGACTFSPESVRVAPKAEFGFDNATSEDHTITGDDGTTWGVAPAGRQSPLIGITKVGTFGFHVSGCAKGGTVIVE